MLQALCTKCNAKLAAVFKAKGDWCAPHELPESICPICHPERGGKPASPLSTEDAPADGTMVRLKKKGTARLAGIEVAKIIAREAPRVVVAPARLAYDATKLARMNARLAGVMKSLDVDLGRRVKKGDILAVIESPEVGASRALLEAAERRLEIARANHERIKPLAEQGVVSRKSALDAQRELADAKSEAAAIAARLAVLDSGGAGANAYTLRAPLDGVVTALHATVGKLVATDEELFEIVDISNMWAQLDIPETELRLIALGQSVTVSLDALPGRTFEGKLAYIAPSVDPHTRTAKARIALHNPDGSLRADLFGEARINAGAARKVLLAPRTALQRAGAVELVFVRKTDEEYETRRVEAGDGDGDLVELKRGVHEGEEVVTTGSFLLKTETLKSSIGAGCCEAD